MPADRDALLALAELVEREEPSRDLWFSAFDEVVDVDRPDRAKLWNRFSAIFDAGAYRDAAAMLMPEGWRMLVSNLGFVEMWREVPVSEANKNRIFVEVFGPHAMARAWMAANLRARAAEVGHD